MTHPTDPQPSQMTETKRFHISDVLSVTTGRLVSTRHMEGVYDILGWMTGEKLWTHQLPRASHECKPVLEAAFPELAVIYVPDDLTDDVRRKEWLASQIERFGEKLEVPQLPRREPKYDTPIADAVEMMGDATKVLVIEP